MNATSPWIKTHVPISDLYDVVEEKNKYPSNSDVVELVRSGTNVRHLTFNASGLRAIGLTTLSLLGKTLVELELKNISRYSMEPGYCDWIVPVLMNCKLHSLALQSTLFSDEMVAHICKEGQNLKKLSLQKLTTATDSETLTDLSLEKISHTLTNLTALVFTNFKEVTTEGLLSLTSLQKLTVLNLQCCTGVNDDLILAIFRNCISISTFSINDSSVTELGMAAICSSKKIKSLGIHLNKQLKIRDYCMLSAVENLEILYVTATALTAVFLEKVSPSLNKLNLYETSITPNEIEEFKRQHPKIKVIYEGKKPEEPSKGWLGGLFG